MDLRFSVLGPVEVSAAGRKLPGTAPRHRAVLAYLLLHAGTVISAERLIDAMWDAEPPDTARAQIHAAVTAIRRVLRGVGSAELLETRTSGYVITPAPGQLDLEEFTSHSAAARTHAVAGDPQAAARQLRAALALWRGQPLADVHAGYVLAARSRLEERRLAAFEQLADLELSLGRHADLIDELIAQVAASPLRERLTGQLMVALYRCGRQADALAVARTLRAALAEQQGLDPGRAFTALEQAVLKNDPGLDLHPAPPASPAPAPGSEPAGGGTATGRSRPANFLPFDLPDFAGRDAELEQLTGTPPGDGSAVTITAIDGMAGVGKTALAVHAAHRLAERFPDGQLFVDLRAHTAGQAPVDPGAALETLLRQLGVPAERIPAADTDRAALWRAELASRRALVVLDNAADTGQVRPLLPGAPGSRVLITSRRRLTGLDSARVLSMDLLPAADAMELFTAVVGKRAAAEPIAALDVLQLCGFLPLAVRIAAVRLQHRPRWTVAYLADRLRDQRRRLSELATAERGVAAAFALSYEQLDPGHQRLCRLLGLHPGSDADAHAAAALAQVSLEQAETLLEDLLDAHVLSQREPGRYTMHDLLREYARTAVDAEETAAVRHEALTRLFDHYLYTASTAIDLAYPYGQDLRPRVEPPGTPAVPLRDAAQAAAWLDAEHANLVAAGGHAADHGWPAHATDLASTLRPYLQARAHHRDALTLHTKALHADRCSGDRAGEARTLVNLAMEDWRQGRYQQAREHTEQALEVSRDIGDRHNESRALSTLAALCLLQRDDDLAGQHLRSALELCRQLGNAVGEAYVLVRLGLVHQRQGRYQQARDHYRQGLEVHRRLGNRAGEAAALDHLGLLHRQGGDLELARAHHRQALDLHREAGNRIEEATPLNGLGEVGRALGEPTQALDDHAAALALAREVGDRLEQARAHDGLARAQHDLGRTDLAHEHAKQALDMYTALGLPDADDARRFLADLR